MREDIILKQLNKKAYKDLNILQHDTVCFRIIEQ